MTKIEIDQLSDSIKEYKACKALWFGVIIHTLQEVRLKVLNSKDFERAINQQMNYFRSLDFQVVCKLADLQIKTNDIEAGLRKICNPCWDRKIRKIRK